MKDVELFQIDAWEVLQYDDWCVNPLNQKHVCFFKYEQDAKQLADSIPGGITRKIDKTYYIYPSLDRYYEEDTTRQKKQALEKAKKFFTEDELKSLGIDLNSG